MKYQALRPQRYATKKSSILTLVGLLVVLVAAGCMHTRRPHVVIDRFFLLYDVVAIGDDQSASWKSSHADSASLEISNEDSSYVLTLAVPVDMPGWQPFVTHLLEPGEYSVTLEVRGRGSDTRTRKMKLVSPYGQWWKFTKQVSGPKDGPWDGIFAEDGLVPVSIGQGADDEERTISISKYVVFDKIKWYPKEGEPWPDSAEGETMTIRKGTNSFVYIKGLEYDYPHGDWGSPTGNYYCTSIWTEYPLLGEFDTVFVLAFWVRSTR